MKIFGPVPSRRLGNSLGINIIPAKICSYSCVYCQIGKTTKSQVIGQVFYDSEAIFKEVCQKIERISDPIDYLTFVADGEPTLDSDLGKKIDLLKPLGYKIAVISNASLIMDEKVQQNLAKADLVSLKVDAAEEKTWRKINRPQKSLNHGLIVENMLIFAGSYSGTLITETMLVKGINDSVEELQKIAGLLEKINPSTVYLSIPTRPPAETWVHPPTEKTIVQAYQQLNDRCYQVETLIGYEGNEFGTTGNVEEDLLSIMAVHPMREDAITEFLDRNDEDWAVIDNLLARQLLIDLEYQGKKFYMRRFSS